MTTHPDLLQKCQNPEWAAACIEGLETRLDDANDEINELIRKDQLDHGEIYIQHGKLQDRLENRDVFIDKLEARLQAALHPQEPTP